MPPRKMASQVVDLTAESSDVEPTHQKPSQEQSNIWPKGSKSQQPLEDSKNIARKVHQPEFDKHKFQGALEAAVSSLSVEQARYFLQRVATNSKESCALLWDELTVDGKDVVRYHADTGSEDSCGYEDEEGSEEEYGSGGGGSSRRRGEGKSIVVTDNEKIARHATCKNCKQEFDVTNNEKGSCVWHTGHKELYEDEDFWADHDDDCHGDPHSFEDDPDFADGFRWTCCDKPGEDEGCKSTKHKAKANMIVKDNPVAAPSKKRKAEEQNPTCVMEPTLTSLSQGHKELSDQNEFWCDYDDRTHGDLEDFIDELACAPGFAWDCCEEVGNEQGCAKKKHCLGDGGVLTLKKIYLQCNS